jgi:membrane protease YdiL (CAAX protease family)
VNGLQELWYSVLAWGILAVSGGLVCLALWLRLPRGERRLLTLPRWRPAPWGGGDVLVASLMMILVPMAMYSVLEYSGFFRLLYGPPANPDPMKWRKDLWAQALAAPFEVAAILHWFWSFRRMGPAGLGLTRKGAAQSAVAGYLLWLVVWPTAMVLFKVLTLFMPEQPHRLEQVIRQPVHAAEPVMAVFLAVVAAAATEELVFRGVIFRWQLGRSLDVQLGVGVMSLLVAGFWGGNQLGTINWPPVLFILAMFPGYLFIPYLCRRSRTGKSAPPKENTVAAELAPWPERLSAGLAGFVHRASDKRVNALLAIYGNGLLFAAVHSTVWPTPIPLFLLGIGLAWIVYRTQNLFSSLVTHALFNAISYLYILLT